ncbi:FG-GAP repeat domain-containing protein [Crocinitomix algicola]|uniref:FG-GAP repeat domain-containing protein n=1 Tax=Crocinitomix algicola TaxID=1740263 RepID=UPI00087258EA|nr:VCBS repeat-containing protein [Crocinitomix algicola]
MRNFSELLLIIAIGIVLLACNNKNEDYDNTEQLTQEEINFELSQRYCTMCHQYPSPELLDKKSWKNHVIPRMGYMLGIYPDSTYRDSLLEPGIAGQRVNNANIFPKQPLINEKDWERIKSYYLTNSPEKLAPAIAKTIPENLTQFTPEIPSFKVSPPSATMIHFSNDQTLYVGDAISQTFLEFDKEYSLIKSGNVKEGAVSLYTDEKNIWLTIMGSFSPTDNPLGFLLTIPKKGGAMARVPIKNLCRPVHSSYADFNGDGATDIVICEFGKWTGELSLWINDGNDNFTKTTLLNQTGALKSEIRDFDGNGTLDIIALFGQGNEGVSIFYNDGRGNFNRDQVLQFSPSNGSSSFDLFDYNNDGFIDIIYTAGDNADFDPIMKPYHGIYIYVNDGNNQFKQEYFFQLNGAYRAIPADFDQDGDWDIAAISFFPDYVNSPNESFVYLENKGQNQFSASTFDNHSLGRWIVMEKGDIDQDGDLDLFLGSLVFEVIPKNDDLMNGWIEGGIPFIVLKNNFSKQ